MSKAKSSSRKKPKGKQGIRFAPNPGVTKVNWRRDVPGDVQVPAAVLDGLDALSIVHTQQRQELKALRETRGTRKLEPVKVPAHLSQGMPLSDSGVRKLADIPAGTSEE